MTQQKTPKTKSTLKALEDVTTSVKRKGAPNSFVFAEEEESFSDDSDSSSTSGLSDSSSEDDVIPTRLRRTAARKKATPAPAKGGKAASGKKTAKSTMDVDELDLFGIMKKTKGDCGQTLANKWLPRADSEPGVCEVLTLLLLAGGVTEATGKVTEFRKSATATLLEASKAVEFENGAPLIQGKTPESKRFLASLSTFFFEVGKYRNKEACIAAFECCQAASKCSMRTVRQAGTRAAMMLGLGLLNRTEQLRKELFRSLKMFQVEEGECEQRMKNEKTKMKIREAAEQFTKSLQELSKAGTRKPPTNEEELCADDTFDEVVEDVQRTMDTWRNAGKEGALSDKARQMANECLKIGKELRTSERRALEGRESVFHEVAKGRFRDLDPAVRCEAAEMLGQWSSQCPDAMSVSHRSKYLGWLMNDKSSNVRAQAVEGLIQLGEAEGMSDEIKQRLVVFANRFVPRVVGMFGDVDPSVAAAALRLCLVWKKTGIITKENDSEVLENSEDMVFHAPERDDYDMTQVEKQQWLEVRQEAANLLCSVDPRLDLANDDDDGDEQDKSRNNIRLRAFVDLMVRHVEGEGGHLEVTWAYEAMYSASASADEDDSSKQKKNKKPHFLVDIETICDVLLDDGYCAQSPKIPQVLVTILVCALERRDPSTIPVAAPTVTTSTATTGRGGRKKTKVANSVAEDDIVAHKLPDLFVKFRSDVWVLERLARAIPFVPCFSNQAQLDKLLRELQSCLTEKSLDQLLEAASCGLAVLCEEKRPESKSARTALDRVCTTTSHAFKTKALAQQQEEDSLPWIKRCAALACGTTAGSDIVGGENGLRDLFIEIKRASSLSEWLIHALRLAFGCVSWSVLESTTGKDASSESLSNAKRNRNAMADAFKVSFELIANSSTSHRKGTSSDVGGLALQVLSLYHDARTVFWPGNVHIGWNPSSELAERADAVFMDKVLPSIEDDPVAIRVAYERVLIPMARCALYASPREDAKSSALVLRFVHDSGNALFRKCALRLNGELRKTDVDRWLQAHLETLSLDASHSDALSKTLGPSSDKVAASIGGPVGGMICRAIRLSQEQRNESILTAVIPYLNFCKVGSKSRDRIIKLWEQVSPHLRTGLDGDPDFGATFESKLLKTSAAVGSKRRQSAGGEDKQVEEGDHDSKEDIAEENRGATPSQIQRGQQHTEKKVRTSQTGSKRKQSSSSKKDGGLDEEESSPKKTPKPLNLVSKKNNTSSSKSKKREDTEIERLERNVFDRSSDSEEEGGDDVDMEEEDAFKDNDVEAKAVSSSKAKKIPPPSKATATSTTSKRPARGAAKAAATALKNKASEQEEDDEDDVDDDDEDDEDNQVIGFRSRINYRK